MRMSRMICSCRPVGAKKGGKRKSKNKSSKRKGKMPAALAAYWRKHKRAKKKR